MSQTFVTAMKANKLHGKREILSQGLDVVFCQDWLHNFKIIRVGV